MPDIEITDETVEAYLNGSLTDMALREMADTVHASEAEQEQLYVDRAGLGDCNLNRETALRCKIFRNVRRLIDERADELERGGDRG